MLPPVLPSVATVLPVSGNTKNGVMARKIKVKICVLPMLPNIIYFPYVISFFFSLSLSFPVSFFFLTSCIFLRQQRQQRQHGVRTPSKRQHLRQQNLMSWQQKFWIGHDKSRHKAICKVLPVGKPAATL